MEIVGTLIGIAFVVAFVAFLWQRAKRKDEQVKAGLSDPRVNDYMMSQKTDRFDRYDE